MPSRSSLPRQGPWNLDWVKQAFELSEVELSEFHCTDIDGSNSVRLSAGWALYCGLADFSYQWLTLTNVHPWKAINHHDTFPFVYWQRIHSADLSSHLWGLTNQRQHLSLWWHHHLPSCLRPLAATMQVSQWWCAWWFSGWSCCCDWCALAETANRPP